METVQAKKPAASKTMSKTEVDSIRKETWINQKEACMFLRISQKELDELLNDGFFLLSHANAKGDRLLTIESVNDYLRSGQRARASDSQFQVKQKARRELQERANGMKMNLSRKIGQMEQQLELMKNTQANNTIDRIANQENMNAVNVELSEVAQKLGI